MLALYEANLPHNIDTTDAEHFGSLLYRNSKSHMFARICYSGKVIILGGKYEDDIVSEFADI